MKRIVLENLRSAYNVGNIVRTADALEWWVIWVGYTARADHKQVRKTSLWAEEHIPKMEFDTIADFLDYAKKESLWLIAAELTQDSISLEDFVCPPERGDSWALIVGNEVTGVEAESLSQCDHIVHIPMLWLKESLNVWQAAAIMMWELGK
jgi:23S rRNA (guanosine2251-2'-O)-methyltransferase